MPDVHTDAWLAHFPTASQPYVRAWFGYAVSQQAQTPEAVLEIVQRVCSRKLEWSMTASTEQLCQGVLLALVHQRREALAYAASLLAAVAAHERGGHARQED